MDLLNLLWLVPLFALIGLAAARWPAGEPVHLATNRRDLDPPGGANGDGELVDRENWRNG